MSTRNVIAVFALGFATLGIMGCGSSSGLQTLTGTVTFEGEPVSEGRIQLREVAGEQRAFAGLIENGQYSVEVPPGEFAVEIRASRPIPGKFDTSNPDQPEQAGEMYIPEKYNSRTELKVTVGPQSSTENFDLTAS